MQGLAAILFPLVLMLVVVGMEKLEVLVMRHSDAVSPDQVDSLLTAPGAADSTPAEVASVATLPPVPIAGSSARRAS
ncbi:MAG: hypothetical protein QM728_01305 [Gordonia sp. (in: high G+C Gram-positive bacteria)]|uniref:hypothetical protein n=1 Tax=Gordonia sp. (in: high G+C Gram-positive bacteria) TaxID=84139 RepID=UPI0039E2483F